MSKKIIGFLWAFIWLMACSSQKQNHRVFDVAKLIQESTLNQHFLGFALYDIATEKMAISHNADKYFIPASNTKLFTFYAGLKTLSDSIVAFRYVLRHDSLIVFPTSDPSFLHPDLHNTRGYSFLKNTTAKIFLAMPSKQPERLGMGWAWDDYNDYYAAECSIFPMYGNIVRFKQGRNSNAEAQVSFFKKNTAIRHTTEVQRALNQNTFIAPDSVSVSFEQDVPFQTSPELLVELLADTLKKPVKTIINQLFLNILYKQSKPFYSLPTDSLYKQMLHPSDNMLAEHLLLSVSAATQPNGELNTKKTIDYVIHHYLADLSDKPQWRDGSGLSRVNLFTPRSLVELLLKIRKEVPQEKLFALLPMGGKTGTLRNFCKHQPPFVFAKTGSLSNNHNLSGFLLTKSNKLLIFSLMNNNFIQNTTLVRKEMERILTEIYEQY